MPSTSGRARTTGLLLLGLLSVGDVGLLAVTDGASPPYAVAAVAAALGLASLWLVLRALRDPSASMRMLVGLRVLSAALAVPAFLAEDVPAVAVTSASVAVLLTMVGVLLLAAGARRPVGVSQ